MINFYLVDYSLKQFLKLLDEYTNNVYLFSLYEPMRVKTKLECNDLSNNSPLSTS